MIGVWFKEENKIKSTEPKQLTADEQKQLMPKLTF